MRKRIPSVEDVQQKHSYNMSDRRYHAMLLTMCKGCSVEASELKLGGDIVHIYRDDDGVPEAVKVVAGEHNELTFYIPVDQIDFFEPTSNCDYYGYAEAWMFI